jgi:hypothetical protein
LTCLYIKTFSNNTMCFYNFDYMFIMYYYSINNNVGLTKHIALENVNNQTARKRFWENGVVYIIMVDGLGCKIQMRNGLAVRAPAICTTLVMAAAVAFMPVVEICGSCSTGVMPGGINTLSPL